MDTIVLLLQVGAVFAVFGVAMWWLKRHGSRSRGAHAGHVNVMATTPLGRSAAVHIVRIGDQTFALGVTDHTVSNLGEVNLPQVPAEQPSAALAPASPPADGTGAAPLAQGSFMERFTAAAEAQGKAPATLVAGVRYVVRALRGARTTAPAAGFAASLENAQTHVPHTEPEPVTALRPVADDDLAHAAPDSALGDTSLLFQPAHVPSGGAA